jgi:ferredoxin-NADP reductase
MIATRRFTIDHIATIAEDTVELGLNTHGRGFEFVPGQYLKLIQESIETDDAHDAFREFSIASIPGDPVVTTAFRISDSQFKRQLIAMPPGTPITVVGPLGVFTLPPDSSKPIVMLAGGVGITPFMSMLSDDRYANYNIRLLYFNSSPERAAYKDELADIGQQTNRSVSFVYQPLTASSLGEFEPDAMYYMAGPPGMIAAARQALELSGIMAAAIRTEEFTGY